MCLAQCLAPYIYIFSFHLLPQPFGVDIFILILQMKKLMLKGVQQLAMSQS